MFCGPQKLADPNMVCIAPSDMGCFSKSAHLPLVLSHPYSSFVREVLLADRVKAVYKRISGGNSGANDGGTGKNTTSDGTTTSNGSSNGSSESTAMDVDKVDDDEADDAAVLRATTKALLGASADQAHAHAQDQGQGQSQAPDAAAVELALWTLQRQARAALVQEYVKCHARAEASAKTKGPPSPDSSSSSSSASSATHKAGTGTGPEDGVVVVAGGACGVHAPCSAGAGGLLAMLAPRKQFTRTKRQAKRDIRQFEKDERRKRIEEKKQRSQRADEYFRELLAHREDFFRFHKAKRADAKKAATAVRVWFESSDVRKEKAEQRAEAARVKALKENDMEVQYATVVVWCGVVWCVMVWCGVVWCGVV